MAWPTAILFDMDGLMLNSEQLYQTAWKVAAADLGYELSNALYLSLVGRSNAEAERAFAQVYGPTFPMAAFKASWQAHWQTLVQTQGIPLQPGLLELLDWLEQRRMPKAVGTSSNREEAEICLAAAGIGDRFSTVVTVDQVAAGKPEPDIFLEAAHRLRIQPSQCLVLEDSHAGVKAAAAAGMKVIMVPDLQEPTAETRAIALHIYPSLHEVLGWLAQPGARNLSPNL